MDAADEKEDDGDVPDSKLSLKVQVRVINDFLNKLNDFLNDMLNQVSESIISI